MKRVRRRRPGERPLWGALPIDAEVEQLHPVPGWVILREVFKNTEHHVGAHVIHIARPYDHHSIFGEILAIHPQTLEDLGVELGTEVVIKEWQGGRWSVNGDLVLITPAWAILAVVEN